MARTKKYPRKNPDRATAKTPAASVQTVQMVSRPKQEIPKPKNEMPNPKQTTTPPVSKQIRVMSEHLGAEDTDVEVFEILRNEKNYEDTFADIIICDYYRRISKITSPDRYFCSQSFQHSCTVFAKYMKLFDSNGAKKALLPGWWTREHRIACERRFGHAIREEYPEKSW